MTQARHNWEQSYEAATETERELMINEYHRITTALRRAGQDEEEDTE